MGPPGGLAQRQGLIHGDGELTKQLLAYICLPFDKFTIQSKYQ